MLICALQFSDFSDGVCQLEQLQSQSPFLLPIVFGTNLIPFFDVCSVDYLLFFHPGCSGMCCFTWATAWSQQSPFVVLAAGLSCFTAGCNGKSPLCTQPLSNRSVLHDGRKHQEDRRLFTIQRCPRISKSYKFAAP